MRGVGEWSKSNEFVSREDRRNEIENWYGLEIVNILENLEFQGKLDEIQVVVSVEQKIGVNIATKE